MKRFPPSAPPSPPSAPPFALFSLARHKARWTGEPCHHDSRSFCLRAVRSRNLRSAPSYTLQPIADDAPLRTMRSDTPEKKPWMPCSCSAAQERGGQHEGLRVGSTGAEGGRTRKMVRADERNVWCCAGRTCIFVCSGRERHRADALGQQGGTGEAREGLTRAHLNAVCWRGRQRRERRRRDAGQAVDDGRRDAQIWSCRQQLV